jgi:hypothetical protein
MGIPRVLIVFVGFDVISLTGCLTFLNGDDEVDFLFSLTLWELIRA